MLACLCGMLAALFGMYRLAPAAPKPEAAATGWRPAARRWMAPLIFLVRVQFIQPTAAVAALWAAAAGELWLYARGLQWGGVVCLAACFAR